MLCLLYPAALLAAGPDSVLTLAASDQSRQRVSGKTRRLKRISCNSHVHQVLIKSLYLYQKEGKGRSVFGDQNGKEVRVEEMATGSAAAGWEWHQGNTKANPRIQSGRRDWGVVGLLLSPHPMSLLPMRDTHLPCVPVLPLLPRLAGHPGRRALEGSLQTSGMFSHCRAPPHCPNCSWMWSSPLPKGALRRAQPSTTQGCGDKQSRGKGNSEQHAANNLKSEGDSADFSREAPAHHVAPSSPKSRFILPSPRHDNLFSWSRWGCWRHGYQQNAALKKLTFSLPQLSHLLPLFPLSHQYTVSSTKEVS